MMDRAPFPLHRRDDLTARGDWPRPESPPETGEVVIAGGRDLEDADRRRVFVGIPADHALRPRTVVLAMAFGRSSLRPIGPRASRAVAATASARSSSTTPAARRPESPLLTVVPLCHPTRASHSAARGATGAFRPRLKPSAETM